MGICTSQPKSPVPQAPRIMAPEDFVQKFIQQEIAKFDLEYNEKALKDPVVVSKRKARVEQLRLEAESFPVPSYHDVQEIVSRTEDKLADLMRTHAVQQSSFDLTYQVELNDTRAWQVIFTEYPPARGFTLDYIYGPPPTKFRFKVNWELARSVM